MSKSKLVIFAFIFFVPVFFILFISSFGKNRYKLPVYFANDSIKSEGNDYKVTDAFVVPDFKLINQDGKEITQKELRGYIYVADFFFTRCGSICPKMTTQLTRVQEAYGKDSLIKIISFTVDPKYDSVSVLKKYALEYNANPKQWNFVTGRKDSIYNLAQKGYFITAMEDTAHPLDFIHSDKLVLIDKQGWIRGYYNGTDQKEVDKLITEISVLKEIYANESNRK